LNYLNAKKVAIFDLVSEFVGGIVDLSNIDPEQLDFANDGELLALAYERLVVVLTHEAFPIKNIEFAFDFNMDELLDAYADTVIINRVLQALRYLSDMTILREALPIALDFAKDLVPADFAFIVEYDGLTKADLVDDVKSVVEVLQGAVDLGAVDLYLTKDMNIENLTPLKNIIERLFDLNLLSGKFDDLAITALSFVGIDEDFYNSLGIDWEDEKQSLLTLIDKLEVLRDTEGLRFKTINQVLDFATDLMNDPFGIITTDMVDNVVDIIITVADSPLIIGISFGVLTGLVVPSLPENIQPLLTLDDIGIDELVEDFESLIDLLDAVKEFGIVEIINGADIPYEKVEEVQTIIRTLFNLNYLNAKKVAIFDLVSEFVGGIVDLSNIDPEQLDFANDGELLALAYERLVVVLTHEAFPIKNIEFAFDFNMDELLDAYADTVIINRVLQALRYLSDMTILREALPIALDFAKDLVPADFAFIVEYDGLTKADLVDDVKSVVEVLQGAVDLGAVDLYLTKDMNIENLTPLKDIIERLFNLNLLSGKFDEATRCSIWYAWSRRS